MLTISAFNLLDKSNANSLIGLEYDFKTSILINSCAVKALSNKSKLVFVNPFLPI